MQDSNVAPPPPTSDDEPAPDSAPPRPPARPAVGPVVLLRADTYKARLQQGPGRWRDVCPAPCNVPVIASGVYRVGGGSIRPSAEFTLPRPSGRVIVEATTGSNIKHWAGIVMIIGGAASILFGALYISNADELSRRDTAGNGPDFYKGVGIGTIIHGVVVAGIGIPLSLSSTEVNVH